MANKRISSLDNLGGTPATGDILPITDISDTTGSAQGTTKGVTFSDLTNHLATQVSLGNHESLTSSVHGISAFGATLVDDANAAAARTTLGMPYISSGTDTNLPSSPATGDVYLETNTGKLRWWDGTYWNTFNYDSQYDPNYAANQLGYSGGLFSSTNYNISTQPIMHFDAAILDGSDQANNPSSGSAVSTWGDRSGQATNYDATQATGSAQPTFNVSGNDKYIAFDGGDVMLLANTYSRASTQAWTIVMVGNGSTTSSNYYAAPNEDGGGSIQLGYYGPLEDIYPGPFVNNVDLTSLNMLTYSRDGSNSLKAHRDGSTLLGSITTAATFIHEGIGRSGGTYTTGRIYECMLFDQILSTTDLNTINSYLSNKYSGLPSLATWS